MIYRDGKGGPSYIKRFAVTSITRDKAYDLTNGNKGSALWYFSANPNGEAEIVSISLRQVGSIKKLKWDVNFADILIKGRASKGNLVTKYAIKRVELKEKGVSTLKPRKIWFDDTVQRLNVDGRGDLIGEFRGEDRILIITQSGIVKTIIPEITAHFDADMIVMEKWIPKKPISAIYFDGEKEKYYVKRFLVENEGKEEVFISNHQDSQLEIVSTDWKPMAEVVYAKERGKDRRDNLEVNLEEFIAVKGIHALGNQLTRYKVNQINLLDPIPFEAPEDTPADELEVVDEEVVSEGGEAGSAEPNTVESSDDEGQTTLF
jgi:topoisomerase-4 subunit A